MVEREPGERPWSIAAITEVLRSEPETMGDPAFGDGLRFRAGDAAAATSVELFATAAAARIITPNVEVTLRNVQPPAVRSGTLMLTAGSERDTRYGIAVSESGELAVLKAARDEPVQSTGAERGPANGPVEVPGEPEGFVAEADQPERGEPPRERVTLFGRVGASPAFRRTASGLLVARFPVAIHIDENQTRWETVVAFGAKAERLRDALQKGQSIEVVGYPHDREVPKRDGTVKNVTEIYAAVVRTR